MPRFDSDPVFCALLQNGQTPDRGHYAIELQDFTHSEQRYLPNTAILATTLYDEHGGMVEVQDFAPRFERFGRKFRPVMLVRRIRLIAGSPRICIRLRPAYGYGAGKPGLTYGSNHIRYVCPDQVLRLTTNASVTAIVDEVPFVLEDDITLLLGPDESIHQPIPDVGREYFERTHDYWRNWVRYLGIPFEWQDEVIRSAITLKLSSYEDTGAIIAALTTSIPEAPGSQRNWDYRYCWLRDSYFVVNALNRLGATKTMEDYLQYIINTTANARGGRLLPVYRINGKADLEEREIPQLPGFRGMGPVRVGNQAYTQIQNDVYGASVLAAAHVFFDRRIANPGNEALFTRLEGLGELAYQHYQEPDAGLWEFRGIAGVHTFTAVMSWSGCQTLAHIAEHLGLQERAQHWYRRAAEMRQVIDANAWDEQRQTYVATFGGKHLDASLLLLRELGYLKADDPRFANTVTAIEKELRHGDFLYRYIREDDFGKPTNAFTICTFWYIDALTALGRREEARALFENVLRCRNPLGLLSEDVETDTRELWGNFPQTYSMVGLINSAMRLSKPWEGAY
ncbi:glucoamylase [Alkalilimnicola ehrlichii]|uniref:Glucoamylase n=2 Tax=Alkalilimnicola ehrlichii TaxID=351052 RepID=A0A3E0X268_9GAMM|nr:glucoamylase [Alkalilimnicola ehrlichii]RFA38412.1 glucoamylase [Alkalilimnicola ehrlichii]